MRILLDTNILISFLLFPSSITQEVIIDIACHHTIVLCSYVIEELRDVCQKKFPTKCHAIETFLKKANYEYIETPTLDSGTYLDLSIRDPFDLPILITALDAEVDILLTGDKDFHNVKNIDFKILTLSEYRSLYLT